MSRIAIVFHSGYGHNEVLAKCIEKGLSSVSGTQVDSISVDSLADGSPNWEILDKADCIVFGSPTYMGSVSAKFKEFSDATSKAWFQQKWKNKFAAGFTVSGSYSGDKSMTMMQIFTLACQHSMIWISSGIMPTGKGENDVNRLGSWSGLMSQADHDKGPDLAPGEGDRKYAEQFGARIASFVAECKK